jgi:HNH endonuclease
LALWGLTALESQPPNQRKFLWMSVEAAIRDAWQTDTFVYAPNWSKALFRLFKLFEPDAGDVGATTEKQLSHALMPYIAAESGFLDLIVDLRDHGWSIDLIRDAVALAGFDLRTLATQFLDMKERVFNLPQANRDRIAKFHKLAEDLRTFKCIYCLQERGRRSYTKAEHVLPQSFGTFEQNITLHDVVCDDCNHYFGTNLEIHLARDTYEGELRFRHGVKDADEFKPSASGRQSRLALRLSEGPFAGCLVTRRYSQQKGEIEVTPLPQVGFLLPDDCYQYFLLNEIPALTELQEKGFRGDRPHAIRGLVVDAEALTRILGERGIPFRLAGIDEPPTDPLKTILCELEGRIDHVILRAIAKISFNYLAKWQGPNFMHRPEFDMARRYIRYGTLPDYEMMKVDEIAILEGEPIEGPRLKGHIITTCWTDVFSVLCQVTLFNQFTYRISLSKEFEGPTPEIRRGHIFDPGRSAHKSLDQCHYTRRAAVASLRKAPELVTEGATELICVKASPKSYGIVAVSLVPIVRSSKCRNAAALVTSSIMASFATPAISPCRPKSNRDQQSNGTRNRSMTSTTSSNAPSAAAGRSAKALATPGVVSDLSFGHTWVRNGLAATRKTSAADSGTG